MKKAVLSVLASIILAGSALAQPPPPPPPVTNIVINTNIVLPDTPPPSPVLVTGTESLLLDTMPGTPDPTQVFPSWATLATTGWTIDTNGLLVDTNAAPSDGDGLPGGSIVGVVLSGIPTNAFVITRGTFLVLLTNDNGELDNTHFEIKIMRNTNDFASLFHEEMMAGEYDTNSTNITLTQVSGNLYTLAVQFPPCVIAAQRVLSIRTEPIDFESPYAQLQWLVGDSGTNQIVAWTTDQDTILVAADELPAMQLWGMPVVGVGLAAQICLTPNLLNLVTVPGTVITTLSNFPSAGAADLLIPDANGVGQADMSQSPTGFYSLRVDGDF